jgi:hypothetical protein
MIALFEKIEIKRIQFQGNDREVAVDCVVTQKNEKIESVLWITFSDLNRILSRLSSLGVETESSIFKTVSMGNNEFLYECNSSEFGVDSFLLEELEFYQPVRQIRA